jgi:excinuclease ABC subunit C
MTTEDYKRIADTIPKDPGVYRFIGEEDTILYVGKAKNLKNRVSSYFGERRDRLVRTRIMVKTAKRLEFTIVESETDALLLETALIKEYRPRYNVIMKDDKSYSYICIKKEPFPRVFFTRKVFRDGSTYFGPYTSKHRTQVIWELLRQLFPLRTCQLNLSPENIASGKFKVCLEYHIKNCQGPCEGLETEESYNAKIEQIKNILKGNFGAVIQHFSGEMARYAERMEFEKAQDIKDKLSVFEDYQAKSTIVSHTIKDVDVFSIASDEKEAYINYLRVVNGAVIHTHTQEVQINLEEEEKDILAYAIPLIRERFNSTAPELIVPYELVLADQNLQVVVPKIGDKRKLLELSLKNVQYYRAQKRRDETTKTKRQSPAERILRTLQADLQMKEIPMHIECFDNSNIQGSNPVSSCVVFKNAKPSKADYRHFKVKTVEGPNDFATMTEVVFRRYRRLLDENQPLPQLVIIDGGKGQLGAAMESITALGLQDKMTVVGIAKRLEEIFFPGDPLPLYINKKSESLVLIQQARNEPHRFAITFHRDQRSKNFIDTELVHIEGIGEKTAQKLLSHFGSVKAIREATITMLAEQIGQAKAKVVHRYFLERKEE